MTSARRHISRALTGALLLSATIIVAFFILRAMPGDPADLRAAATGGADSDTRAALRREFGLNDAWSAQLLAWLRGLAQGDLGRSFATDRAIGPQLAQRAPWSFAIGGGGLIIGAIAGFMLGFLAALRNGPARLVSRAAAVLGQSTPAFGVGLLIIWIFGVQLNWIRAFTGGLLERLALPIGVIALIVCGPASRVALAAFEDARRAPWFCAARAKGLSERAALWRHAGPHARLAALAGLTPELAWVVGGSAVTEIIFATPGLGGWAVEAIGARDYPVLQVYCAITLLWLAAAHAGVNWLQRRLDPRRRA